MTRLAALKLALAVSGIALFFWANREDRQTLRWIAIGLVAAAWVLRFAARKPRGDASQGPSM